MNKVFITLVGVGICLQKVGLFLLAILLIPFIPFYRLGAKYVGGKEPEPDPDPLPEPTDNARKPLVDNREHQRMLKAYERIMYDEAMSQYIDRMTGKKYTSEWVEWGEVPMPRKKP